MEYSNNKVINSFISYKEKEEIIKFVSEFSTVQNIENIHIKSVRSELKGSSFMFDLTNTKVSNYLSDFQSSGNIQSKQLPDIFFQLKERISSSLSIPDTNVFMQIIKMEKGGKIRPHYDSSMKGMVNYKCNIAVQSEDYTLFVEKEKIEVKEKDLYCFEASLYKHWTEAFKFPRIILSYGFALPYVTLNRSENDPRVRLSERLIKMFQ